MFKYDTIKRLKMKIAKLNLINFRNYENLDIEFSDNLNIIYGNNGSGKSNLVEAIYLLALTKSFRTSNDHNLINKNSKFSVIKGTIIDKEKTIYQIDFDATGKKVFIDADKVKKISDYVSRINIVLFNPLDTKVITDAPVTRRKMLDISISQCNKEYLILLSSYNKILKHRNAYLKQLYLNGNASSEYINILTDKLIDIGLKIHQIRTKYIANLNEHLTNIYKNIFEYGHLEIKYTSDLSGKTVDKLHESYKKLYRKEMAVGKTLLGIHHDDITFMLDDNNIREYGSIGQQKNAIISYKLSELLIVKQLKGEYPILILDDLFSELDSQKILNIIKMLNKEVQTFITTTDITNIKKELLVNCNLYKVENQKVEREKL